jgi:AcrR family transcriptional regulator
MTAATRKQKEKENLKREIMDAAREMFVEKGYEAVSMRKIAERINYSPTTIYLYFEDKSDLMGQICDRTFAQLTRRLKAIIDRDMDPIERLRAGITEYVNFGLRHPSDYHLLFNTHMPDPPRVPFARSNVEAVSQSLWMGMHGITSLLITQRHFPFVSRKRLIEQTVDILIEGVKA